MAASSLGVQWEGGKLPLLPSLRDIVDALAGINNILELQQRAYEVQRGVIRAQNLTSTVIGGVDALVRQIENVVLDLLRVDGYVLPVGPVGLLVDVGAAVQVEATDPALANMDTASAVARRAALGIAGGFNLDDVVRQVQGATYDVGDPARPQFSGSAWVGGAVVLVGVNTLVQVRDVIALIDAVLDGARGWTSSLKMLSARIDAVGGVSVAPSARAAQSVPPDWRRVSSFLPASVEGVIQEALDRVRTLAIAGNTTAVLNSVDNVMTTFYTRLTVVLSKLIAILDVIANASDSMGLMNVYRLNIEPLTDAVGDDGLSLGGGGTGVFLHRLASAANPPQDPYLVGCVFLVGGPAPLAVQGQWELLQRSVYGAVP